MSVDRSDWHTVTWTAPKSGVCFCVTRHDTRAAAERAVRFTQTHGGSCFSPKAVPWQPRDAPGRRWVPPADDEVISCRVVAPRRR